MKVGHLHFRGSYIRLRVPIIIKQSCRFHLSIGFQSYSQRQRSIEIIQQNKRSLEMMCTSKYFIGRNEYEPSMTFIRPTRNVGRIEWHPPYLQEYNWVLTKENEMMMTTNVYSVLIIFNMIFWIARVRVKKWMSWSRLLFWTVVKLSMLSSYRWELSMTILSICFATCCFSSNIILAECFLKQYMKKYLRTWAQTSTVCQRSKVHRQTKSTVEKCKELIIVSVTFTLP